MTRRSALLMSSSLAFAPLAKSLPAAPAGRLKQSAARWCYSKIAMDDLCRQAAELGLVGLDLVDEKDWPTCKKYGLVPAIVSAAASIPNVITFSGNRKGLADDAGRDTCILGLKRVAKIAEDAGITICMELLNSKVNHKDYQCDHTQWGVDVCKAVGSPRVKLLYDIYHMQIMEGDIIRTIRDFG